MYMQFKLYIIHSPFGTLCFELSFMTSKCWGWNLPVSFLHMEFSIGFCYITYKNNTNISLNIFCLQLICKFWWYMFVLCNICISLLTSKNKIAKVYCCTYIIDKYLFDHYYCQSGYYLLMKLTWFFLSVGL